MEYFAVTAGWIVTMWQSISGLCPFAEDYHMKKIISKSRRKTP
jgi:hypothetical protein